MTEELEIAGQVKIGGKWYARNGEGHLVPAELVKPQHGLEDEMVRKIIGFAEELSAQIDRFKGHCTDDIAAFEALLAQEYGTPTKRGRKGNVTFFSYDSLLKVEVRLAETLSFGAELHAAKALIDDCIRGWASDANAPIRLLIQEAFRVDQEGHINRNAILNLRRVQIDDERWVRAMEAITASIRVVGSKTYLRFWRRSDLDAPWQSITVDLASAEAPSPPAKTREAA